MRGTTDLGSVLRRRWKQPSTATATRGPHLISQAHVRGTCMPLTALRGFSNSLRVRSLTTSMSIKKPSILLIGIAWSEYTGEQKDTLIQQIKGMLDQGEKQLRDAGYDYQYLEYAPSQDASRLKALLNERRFDGVCVGIGIRRNPQYTALFEMLVNSIHETAPHAKLLFNSTPSDTVEAAKRCLPQL